MTKAQDVIDSLRVPRVGDTATVDTWNRGMKTGTVVMVDGIDGIEGGMCVVKINIGGMEYLYRRFFDEVTIAE